MEIQFPALKKVPSLSLPLSCFQTSIIKALAIDRLVLDFGQGAVIW